MQQLHHHSSTGDGDGPDASSLVAIMRARARRATTLTAWTRRSNDMVTDLRAELGGALDAMARQHEEITYWRSKAADILGLDPDSPPPPQYVEALCTPQQEPCRLVDIEVDGEQWPLSLGPDRSIPDPLGVLIAWHEFVAGVRRAVGDES